MAFKDMTAEQHAAFVTSLKYGHYNLLLGAGVSTDSKNSKGNLPASGKLRNDLCALKGISSDKSLQKIYSLLDEPEIDEHITQKFIESDSGPTLKALSAFLWKRAFTFNIDDALENAYANDQGLQKLIPFNFDDDYDDSSLPSELPLIHLHGFVRKADSGYVFSRDAYIRQMTGINPWMTVLTQFIKTEPFIIAGSSLDEVDLDYYLAYRKATSGREDRGPSILVEPFPDAITHKECEQHGLLLFHGTALEFFAYCESVAPNRPTPVDLISVAAQRLLPASISKRASLAFWSDFELVPGKVDVDDRRDSRFLYGYAPDWEDLAEGLDIPRQLSLNIVEQAEAQLKKTDDSAQLLLLLENVGAGKSTVLLRCAYELAQRGYAVLNCTALSRLEPLATADMIDMIDKPVVIVADNFADQVGAFSDILQGIEKRDVIVLGAERIYRFPYIKQVLGGENFQRFRGLELGEVEVHKLIDKYVDYGLVGSSAAISRRASFVNEVQSDPIAVACCRILNDFRPLDRIISGIWSDGTQLEQDRYLAAALAQHCFRGGVRYSVLLGTIGDEGVKNQILRGHPLPLTVANYQGNSFVTPQNAALASRILQVASEENGERLFNIAVSLANSIAVHVNRKAIIKRTPEARLAGRLFDYDAIVFDLLKDRALDFYVRTQSAWQWNSRYWEQVALLKLSVYHQSPDTKAGQEALDMAVQHARHAVSIEYHPLPLTTLGKVLLAQMKADGYSLTSTFNEAFEHLEKAIQMERQRSRISIHPFISLFRGVREYLGEGGKLSSQQRSALEGLQIEAKNRFSSHRDVQDALDELYISLRYS